MGILLSTINFAAILQAQRFGGGGDSHVHPLIALAVFSAAVAMIAVSREWVTVIFLGSALLIPMDQIIIVGGLHFQMVRVLILAGALRLVIMKLSSKRDLLSGGINSIDKALVLLAILTAIDTVLLWQDSAALINQLGMLYTTYGLYFLLRSLIRSADEVSNAIKALAYISAAVAVIMVIEQATGHNPYAYVWAAGSGGRTVMERDGHLRAMACFAHPLLAGTYGGITLPLFFALWAKDRKYRFTAVIGMIAAATIVLAANSSTPLLAFLGGLLALFLWPLRKHMRVLRWALVITLTVLHLVMKAPVWALIARIDVTGSSSSYHRFQLVDQFIRRFGDWWLLGTKSNGQWGWDMWDLANQYVAVGETSGLLPFICFIAIIVYGFKYIGKARKAAQGQRGNEFFIWAIGAALFANVVAFFGISYFDQTVVAWYALLAMIPAAASAAGTVRQGAVAVIPAERETVVDPEPGPALPISGLAELLERHSGARSA